jgi:hypothetical protein
VAELDLVRPVKTTTILYLCLLVSFLGGISAAVSWGSRAYVTHIAVSRLDPTPQEKERLDQLFDSQISTASGGATIALFQAIAFYYLRKLVKETKLNA